MFRQYRLRSLGQLFTCAGGGFIIGVLLTGAPHVGAQAAGAAASSPAGGQAQAASNARVFGSDAGVVLNFVKADKTTDFEAVMSKLREALQKSDKPERRQQAEGWKIYRALEPGANGSVLYVFVIDPAVKQADYTVANILAEGFPDEVQALYKKYADSYASGQNIVNLNRVASAATGTAQ